jgi:hypothetical protein
MNIYVGMFVVTDDTRLVHSELWIAGGPDPEAVGVEMAQRILDRHPELEGLDVDVVMKDLRPEILREMLEVVE